MVRLLHTLNVVRVATGTAVSIPQWCDCCLTELARRVGANKVSIPQWCDCCQTPHSYHKHNFAFQSHNGAIAASSPKRKSSKVGLFQSHNGAIAALFLQSPQPLFQIVSIPQWCDCCKVLMATIEGKAVVSIPQWCDCCLKASNWLAPRKRWFQSHNGAIAANRHKDHRPCSGTVSIPQWCDCCVSLMLGIFAYTSCFNPTMVRLLPLTSLLSSLKSD